jgi:hypothetical protein
MSGLQGRKRWFVVATFALAIAYATQLVPHAHGHDHDVLAGTHHSGSEQRGVHSHRPDHQHHHGAAEDHRHGHQGHPDAAPEADSPQHAHHHHVLTWHIDLHSLRVQPRAIEAAPSAAVVQADTRSVVNDGFSLPPDREQSPPGFTPVSSIDARGPPPLS